MKLNKCFSSLRIFVFLSFINVVLGQNLFDINRSNFNKGDRFDLNAKFLKQSDNITLVSGKRLLLKCRPNITLYIKDIQERKPSMIKYEWLRDNKPVNASSKTKIYKDGSLEINQASESDTGFYKCLVHFSSLKFESRQAYVKIVDRKIGNSTVKLTAKKTVPRFNLMPEDRTVRLDDEVIFDCLALYDSTTQIVSSFVDSNSDSQYFRYKWLKDGVALDLKKNENHFQLVQGYSLKIERIRESDSGTYTCRICNLNGNNQKNSYYDDRYDYENFDSFDSNSLSEVCDERSSFLKVQVPPSFIRQPPSMLNVTVKSDVELECSAYGIPSPSIQWFKNGEPIYQSEYFQLNPHTGSLKILGIIKQDEGYYQCLATNELNAIQSVALLVVQSNENDIIGDDYHSSSIEYFDITTSTSTKGIIYASSTQPIVHLSAPDKLKLVRNKSRSILVEWQSPSIIRDELNQESEDAENNVDLIYSLSWKVKHENSDSDKTNKMRQREINTTNMSHLIDDLVPETVYLIQVCAIFNQTRSPYAFLEAKTLAERQFPGKPVNFRSEFVDENAGSSEALSFEETHNGGSNRALRLTWEKPSKNANNILKYRLYYEHLHYGPIKTSNESLSAENYEDEVVSSLDDQFDYSDTSVENGLNFKSSTKERYIDIEANRSTERYSYEVSLDHLHMYSTYRFRLVTLDANNMIENSANESMDDVMSELVIETPSDVPDAAPENILIETLNTSSVLLQWNLPPVEKRNGLIIGYKITVKEKEKEWNFNVDSEPRRKVISGLLPGHKYLFGITARTVNGSGPISDWFIAETFTHEMNESRAPGQPIGLYAEPTDTSIIIRWTPPSDFNTTVVRKYVLKYGIGFPITEVEISGARNSFIINNLSPSSQYVISLKAVNKAGFGMEILKDVITKRKSAFGESESLFPPLNVQAVSISSTSIEVRWTDSHLKPNETVLDDRYYTVRYCVAASSGTLNPDSSETISEIYRYKNSTERRITITGLVPSTLYDFSVRLAVGSRQSDWSLTASQMTMEAYSAPEPRLIKIINDPNSPTTAIISWTDPKQSSAIGYAISYIEEAFYKAHSNKWKIEHVSNTQSKQGTLQHRIKKLKPETVYYFKIQSRSNRGYGTASPINIFKTPNLNGEGGKIFSNDDSYEKVPIIVLNSQQSQPTYMNKTLNRSSISLNLEMNIILVIIIGLTSLFILVFVLLFAFVCNRASSGLKVAKKIDNIASNSHVYEHNTCLIKKSNENNVTADELDQQQHLIQKGKNCTELIMQTHMSSNSSSNSTLLKQTQPMHRTPMHQIHLYNHQQQQPLIISNPMLSVLAPLTNNSQAITDIEFYSNINHTHQNCYNNQDILSAYSGVDQINATEEQINSTLNNNMSNIVYTNINNDPMSELIFMKNTIRPKPIAIPINSNSPIGQNQGNEHTLGMLPEHSMENPNIMMNKSQATRKSLKNLPMATARPFIVDNQVVSHDQDQQQLDVAVSGRHSPSASSSHSGRQKQLSQLYDKLGEAATSGSKSSLLHPLKSFGASYGFNGVNLNQQSPLISSISIPNTPAKYCDRNIAKSSHKNQMLVSLDVNTNCVKTTIDSSNGEKISMDNIYDKVMDNSNQKSNNLKSEELAAEMALEGVMNDLKAITEKQFEC